MESILNGAGMGGESVAAALVRTLGVWVGQVSPRLAVNGPTFQALNAVRGPAATRRARRSLPLGAQAGA